MLKRISLYFSIFLLSVAAMSITFSLSVVSISENVISEECKEYNCPVRVTITLEKSVDPYLFKIDGRLRKRTIFPLIIFGKEIKETFSLRRCYLLEREPSLKVCEFDTVLNVEKGLYVMQITIKYRNKIINRSFLPIEIKERPLVAQETGIAQQISPTEEMRKPEFTIEGIYPYDRSKKVKNYCIAGEECRIYLKILAFSNLSQIDLSGSIKDKNIVLNFEKLGEEEGPIIEVSAGRIPTKRVIYSSQPFVLEEGTYVIKISGEQKGLTLEGNTVSFDIYREEEIEVLNIQDFLEEMFKKVKIIGRKPYFLKEVHRVSKTDPTKVETFLEETSCISNKNCDLSFEITMPRVFQGEKISGTAFIYKYDLNIFPPNVSLYKTLEMREISCWELEEIYGEAFGCRFVSSSPMKFDEGFYRIVYSVNILNNSISEILSAYIPASEEEEIPIFIEKTVDNRTVIGIYREGRFIGIIPVKYKAKVYFDKNGLIDKIQEPWWSVLVIKK